MKQFTVIGDYYLSEGFCGKAVLFEGTKRECNSFIRSIDDECWDMEIVDTVYDIQEDWPDFGFGPVFDMYERV